MAQYTHRCELRLTEQEHADLVRKAEKAGLSISEFIRRAVAGCTVKEAPPPNYRQFIIQLRRIGSNIDQILRFAYAQDILDVPHLRKTLKDLWEIEERIGDYYY